MKLSIKQYTTIVLTVYTFTMVNPTNHRLAPSRGGILTPHLKDCAAMLSEPIAGLYNASL